MILADKIINERKRNGWSQEELAERLGVSRQSVSKWESAQSVPDLNRILQLADLFGVTTDYLLKDEIESKEGETVITEAAEPATPLRRVSMEEASEFIALEHELAPKKALGAMLFVLSPVLLIFLAGLSESNIGNITENMAAGIGVVVMFAIIAAGVSIFIITSAKEKRFNFLEKEEIETAYGVDGMVRDKLSAFEPKRIRHIVIGVLLCLFCYIPVVIAALSSSEDYIIISMVCVLLIMVAAAVYLFTSAGVISATYNKLIQEGDYTVKKKSEKPVLAAVSTVYWVLATAIFFFVSFVKKDWENSWIVWPVAGVLYAAVVGVVNLITKNED